jgi:hypothetical protein
MFKPSTWLKCAALKIEIEKIMVGLIDYSLTREENKFGN